MEPANQWDALWESFEQRVGAKSPAWLMSILRAGNAHFSELGFPTTEDEEWRFTPLNGLAEIEFQAVDGLAELPARDPGRSRRPCGTARRVCRGIVWLAQAAKFERQVSTRGYNESG